MFPDIPSQESIVIVEAKGRGKYAKQLYNLIGTNDDDGENIIGPVDRSVEATIFDKAKFINNPLTSDQKYVFVGDPKFAKDYLDVLESDATDKFDACGIRIRIGGKHASIAVDKGGESKEAYWEFLSFAAECGQEFPDLLADLHDDNDLASPTTEMEKSKEFPVKGALRGIANGARDIAGNAGAKVSTLRKASAVLDQKYRFAIRYFYLVKLRSFVES